PDGRRRTIRLGAVSQSNAETVKSHVEHLVSALLTGSAPPDNTSHWVADLNVVLYDKLAEVELVTPREPQQAKPAVCLGAYLDRYIDNRQEVAANTRRNWRDCRSKLVEHFGESRPIDQISPGDADGWVQSLVNRKYSPA